MALRNIDDLFEMFLQVYERALLVTCPILLLFAHYCRISAERSATFRLLASCAPQKSGVLIAALAIIWNLLGH